MKKKILFVTGTRADFGKLEPLAVELIHRNYEVIFFVTGMHMLESYGLTKLEVHRLEGAQIMVLNQDRGMLWILYCQKQSVDFLILCQKISQFGCCSWGSVEALACSIALIMCAVPTWKVVRYLGQLTSCFGIARVRWRVIISFHLS